VDRPLYCSFHCRRHNARDFLARMSM
jgi:hypothetical protein